MPSARKGRKALPDDVKFVEVAKPSHLRGFTARDFMDFINPFAGEKAYIRIRKKKTLAQERKWLAGIKKDINDGNHVRVLLVAGGKLAGVCDALRKSPEGESGNVHFGLAVSKKFRGRGFGELLLRKCIALARKKLKPHRMWIEYVEGNEPAERLYRKVGFVECCRLDEYVNHYGKWRDHVLMAYKGKK